ncbi:hypothetical protein ABH973_003620 [Bradyrhizobium ottawaense]|uniref:hypothetical protein n=1 Tax=Bradyrhizobium ottawaense TaxID=931866 RepID=UPI00351768C5
MKKFSLPRKRYFLESVEENCQLAQREKEIDGSNLAREWMKILLVAPSLPRDFFACLLVMQACIGFRRFADRLPLSATDPVCSRAANTAA